MPPRKKTTKAASEGIASVVLTEEKRGRGRPSKFENDFYRRVKGYALLGLTNLKIAELLDIDEKTFYNWQNEDPEFFQSIKDGREAADAKVAETMYNQALNGNVTAGIFWLCNRQKEHWRQRQEVSGPDGTAAFQPVINVSTNPGPA